jgi:signal transduction histidine kinase
MRERIALVGGRLELESSGKGTTIVVEVPTE